MKLADIRELIQNMAGRRLTEILVTGCVTCLAVCSGAIAETLDEQADIVGDWQLAYVSDMDVWAKVLRIEAGRFMLCETTECIKPVVGRHIEFLGDLVFLSIKEEEQVQLKLVLGGYREGAESVLFGTRYHYHKGEIISGLPAVYDKTAVSE